MNLFWFLKASFITLIFILLFTINANARSLDEIQKEGNLIVAVYEDFPPYSYIEDGKEKGIDIEIAHAIAKKMGVKAKIYWTGSDENLEDDLRNVIWKGHLIHRTKADVMFRIPYDYEFIRQTDKSTGELSNELVVMKSPYQAERWVIATNKEKIDKIDSLAIFQYHKIGVELDTLPDAHLSSSFRGKLQPNVKHYRTIKEAVDDLKDGKIDAVAGLKSQLEFFFNYNKNKDKYYMSKEISFVKSIWDIGVAVRTDFRALSYEIDGQMLELYKNKTIKKIFEKYKVNYEAPTVFQDF